MSLVNEIFLWITDIKCAKEVSSFQGPIKANYGRNIGMIVCTFTIQHLSADATAILAASSCVLFQDQL